SDPATLKNCALVCSSLQVASQELLFATTAIEIDAADNHLRLEQLNSSPHLISYIRHLKLNLSIPPTADWQIWLGSGGQKLLNLLQAIPLAKIHSFTFSDHCTAHGLTSLVPKDPPIAKALLNAIAQICASPSLHTLEIARMRSLVLLKVCNSSLQNLFIADLHLFHTSHKTVTPELPIRNLSIKMKNFEFVFHPGWGEAGVINSHFLNSDSGIAFHALTHLHVFGLETDEEGRIQGILAQCQNTLEGLVLGSYVGQDREPPEIPALELATLKKLKSLHLTYPLGFAAQGYVRRLLWLKKELALFSDCRPSKLQNFVFTYVVDPDLADLIPEMGPWSAISSLLAQDTLFPDLKRVEILTRLWDEEPLESDNQGCCRVTSGLHALAPCFQELSAKGILEVRHMGLARTSKMGKVSFGHDVQPRVEPYSAT
ncbi:hypothetical protein BKA70DRAFT_1290899, partial [Coprinopsis sp. MPI-PUGE-AT-0042]